MYLVDANILIYAANDQSPMHKKAHDWLEDALEGPEQTVGLPWESLLAYVRIATDPRLYAVPPTSASVLEVVDDWLKRPASWIPGPGPRHFAHLDRHISEARATGKLVNDAHIAALAKQHALTVVTADSDFARFPSVPTLNPYAG